MPAIKPVTIARKSDVKAGDVHDFAALRQQAIDLLQQMAGSNWTDYNLHDPGVTIIEQLCFAITDLAYRTNFPIQDLLADAKGQIDYKKNSFYTPDEILFSRPVTANDFRKILIDRISEIDNVWLTPLYSRYAGDSVKGVYQATVQVSRDTVKKWKGDVSEEQRVKQLVRAVFVSERNLCEDLSQEVKILKPVSIKVKADIVITEQYQPELLLAHIYSGIENLLSAKVKYYTEAELLDLGYSYEEIHSGPRLHHGLIPDRELRPRKNEIDPIELTQLLSRIEGVVQVKEVALSADGTQYTSKPLKLEKDCFPFLDEGSGALLKLFTNKYQVHIKQAVFQNLLVKLHASQDRTFVSSFYNAHNERVIGRHQSTSQYYSIQHNFPHIYGIGREGLPIKERTAARIGQVKQLKAYLVLFEQLLSNYLYNLSHIEDYFCCSLPRRDDTSSYYQPPYDIPELGDILKSFYDGTGHKADQDWENFVNDKENGYQRSLGKIADNNTQYQRKKHKQFDHLLARFNTVLIDYPVKLYREVYNAEHLEDRFSDTLKWKRFYLNNIANIQRGETKGFNYLKEVNDSTVFDFEKKIKLLLCIKGFYYERKLSDAFNNGKLAFEPSQTMVEVTHPPAEEAIWIEDVPQIVMPRKEAQQLHQNQLNHSPELSENQIFFAARGMTLFSEAIVYKNYRIIPDFDQPDRGVLLLFKYPQDNKWDVISRYQNDANAMAALRKLVAHFRNISMDSEGLYVVDHVLLRPSLTSKAYTFRLLALDKVVHTHPDCNDFWGRETDIDTALKHYNHLTGLRVELLVKLKNMEIIAESFFDFQLTVLLPLWPARFQDDNFKSFVKELILLNVPANIKVNICWLSLQQMRKFENHFFEWKASYQQNNDKRYDLAEHLISLVQAEI
ncbi:hypothetical protein HH214_10195 [Mucilaginibacter robiniae]|uniref:Uncharacterized protein n=1 Tax=Mucilaginibacter robiniae TaxID=2728022 RepID=A0A7L5DYN3_9SPHI|nr:hypothetical protein [Mucilaginibacter robiniae]QJD96210.1 hypothetical protein HH214_10195 [Mucilaginibacter robiniae]